MPAEHPPCRRILLWISKLQIRPHSLRIDDNVKYDNENENEIIEDIITENSPDWEDYWKKLGTDVMIKCLKYGRVFVKLKDEDLVFVSRKK